MLYDVGVMFIRMMMVYEVCRMLYDICCIWMNMLTWMMYDVCCDMMDGVYCVTYDRYGMLDALYGMLYGVWRMV